PVSEASWRRCCAKRAADRNRAASRQRDREAADRKASTAPCIANREHTTPRMVASASRAFPVLLHAPLHLFRRHVFDLRCDHPNVTEWIFQRPGARSVELILDR